VDDRSCRLQQRVLVDEAQAVGQRGTAKSVTVRDLNDRHTRIGERRCNRNDLSHGELVADTMGTVSQRAIRNPN
jgi:hypothetical protein